MIQHRVTDIVRQELLRDEINVLIMEYILQLERQLTRVDKRLIKEYQEKRNQTNRFWAWLTLTKPPKQTYVNLYDVQQQFLSLTSEKFWHRLQALESAGFIELWDVGDEYAYAWFVKIVNYGEYKGLD